MEEYFIQDGTIWGSAERF